jgi:cellulose synthase/poly-beta-1,6-N-acetylglucosamine synthase-like glycosyltransferase
VIIPAYTMKRWPLTQRAVESVGAQTVPPEQIVLCIDNNEELYKRGRQEWSDIGDPPILVLPNRHNEHMADLATHEKAHGSSRRFGAGSVRNSALEVVTADIVAFMDDDAHAEPDWLERLLAVYEIPGVVAAGGAPVPDYAIKRPVWFPANFNWVFGCAYEGLPESRAPLRHLIGANMSVRRSALQEVGGFHSVDFDDLDLCMRLADRYGTESLYYDPSAIVHHHVSADRLTWRYFYRRCFFINREKVRALRDMGAAANLHAEREFVLHSLRVQTKRQFGRALRRRPGAFRSLAAMAIGIMLAGLGYLRGLLDARFSGRHAA